jgi:molybdopterin-binding protein
VSVAYVASRVCLYFDLIAEQMHLKLYRDADNAATVRGVPTFRIKEAADLLGVSDDTVRRWADGGRITTTTDRAGRQVIDGAVLARFAEEAAEASGGAASRVVVAESMRNRFTGLVTRVVRDTVMAQVEIQAGPHRFVSLLSREAVDDLGLEPGVLAVAAVKATNVSVEIPRNR